MKNGKGLLLVAIVAFALATSLSVSSVKATTPEEIEDAIDKGLTWLAGQQNPDGSWGWSYRVAQTGMAVLKFETHAINLKLDPLDPSYTYYAQVRNGLDFIFSMAHEIPISTQPAGDPDTNDNDIGVYIYDNSWDRMYETGIAAMAIAHSKHPEMVVDVPGSEVDGWTYEEVLTDVVDYIAYGQNDLWGDWRDTYRGGWRYEENEGSSDNSVSGYAVLGLVYAESPPPIGFGLTIPAFVKTELNYWIDYIQTDVTGGTDDGGSGYSDPGYWVNILKTGNLLQEMAFVDDTLATPRVQDAIDYIERYWDDESSDPGWRGWSWGSAHKQAMFTTMKGFVAFGIDTITVERGVPTTVDWFDEMATVLVAQQNSDGSWADDYWASNPIASTWALLVLEKAAPPVAKYDLTVHVKDAVTGNPISGAKVEVVGPESRSGFTDGGSVTFLDLLTGVYTATASASGYQSNSVSFTLDQDKQVQIELIPSALPPHAKVAVVWTTDKDGNPKVEFNPRETVYLHWVADGLVNITVYYIDGSIDQQWLNLDKTGVKDFVPGKGTGYYSINCTACKEQTLIAYGTIFVIPETLLGTIGPMIAAIASMVGCMRLRRKT